MVAQDTPPEERVQMLTRLYPWYKEEVYRRRHQMIWLTVLASTVLVVLLFLVPTLPPPRPTRRAWGVLGIAGVVLFSAGMISFLLQQWARHRMAKQVLITIEQGLGLYEKGRYVEEVSLYPEDWQHAWVRDRSIWIYLTLILLLTVLVLLALVFR